jgi:hypothetical protein
MKPLLEGFMEGSPASSSIGEVLLATLFGVYSGM